MSTVDQVKRCYPKGIAVSAAGINNHWQTSVEFLSQRYTTHWNELVRVKCS